MCSLMENGVAGVVSPSRSNRRCQLRRTRSALILASSSKPELITHFSPLSVPPMFVILLRKTLTRRRPNFSAVPSNQSHSQVLAFEESVDSLSFHFKGEKLIKASINFSWLMILITPDLLLYGYHLLLPDLIWVSVIDLVFLRTYGHCLFSYNYICDYLDKV